MKAWRPLGKHLIVELFGCEFSTLNNEELLRRTLLEAARAANMQVVGEVFHRFNPQGVTGIVAVAESHISIHTWPEHGYASVDIFTCGDRSDPWKAYEHIVSVLKPHRVNVLEIRRGFVEQEG